MEQSLLYTSQALATQFGYPLTIETNLTNAWKGNVKEQEKTTVQDSTLPRRRRSTISSLFQKKKKTDADGIIITQQLPSVGI